MAIGFSVTLGLTTWSAPIWDNVRGELENAAAANFPQGAIEVAVVGRPAVPAEMAANA